VVLNGSRVEDAYLVVAVQNMDALDDSSCIFAFEERDTVEDACHVVAGGSMDALEDKCHLVVLLDIPDTAVPPQSALEADMQAHVRAGAAWDHKKDMAVRRACSPRKARKQGQSALVGCTQTTCLAAGQADEVLYIAHLHLCPKANSST
jgi:hypothetical protein